MIPKPGDSYVKDEIRVTVHFVEAGKVYFAKCPTSAAEPTFLGKMDLQLFIEQIGDARVREFPSSQKDLVR